MSTTTQPDDIVAIERTAELGAVVLHFGDPKTAEVLERLDEDPARYRRSQDHWVAALAGELSRNREALARDFGVAFARKREELERDDPSIESLGPLRPVARVEAPPEPVAEEVALELKAVPVPVPVPVPDASPPAIEVPSFMQVQKREAPPVATVAAAPFPPPVAAPARPAEPFTASTEPLDLEHLRNMLFRGPTPFRGETTPERLAEIKAEAASANEDVGGAVPSADETAMYMPSAEERKRLMTLPFKPAEPSAADTPSAATEIVHSQGEAPGADEKAMLMPSDAMRAAISALPFASEKGPGAALTVEGYAALAAELVAHGATAEVLAKFQIADLDRLREVHAEQERRFAADPTRRAYFEKLRAIMVQALREKQR